MEPESASGWPGPGATESCRAPIARYAGYSAAGGPLPGSDSDSDLELLPAPEPEPQGSHWHRLRLRVRVTPPAESLRLAVLPSDSESAAG